MTDTIVVWLPGGFVQDLAVPEALEKIPELTGDQGYVWERRGSGVDCEETWREGYEHRTLEEAVEKAIPCYRQIGLTFEQAVVVCFATGLVVSTGVETEEEDGGQ